MILGVYRPWLHEARLPRVQAQTENDSALKRSYALSFTSNAGPLQFLVFSFSLEA